MRGRCGDSLRVLTGSNTIAGRFIASIRPPGHVEALPQSGRCRYTHHMFSRPWSPASHQARMVQVLATQTTGYEGGKAP